MDYSATYDILQTQYGESKRLRELISSTTHTEALEEALTRIQNLGEDYPHNPFTGTRVVRLTSLISETGQEIPQNHIFNKPYVLNDGKTTRVEVSCIDKVCRGLEIWDYPQTD